MKAAALRKQIETVLAQRQPGALTPQLRMAPERLPTGIAELDALLSGGLPVGAITEMVGSASSGRTTLALAFAGRRLAEGQVCAWVDVSDSLDPESAAAAGVDLDRLLWVRCGTRSQQLKDTAAAEVTAYAASIDRTISVASSSGGCGSPHPRAEGRGLPEAIHGLMGFEHRSSPRDQTGGNKALLPVKRRDKSIGTPGAPNRSVGDGQRPMLWRSANREEQVATDRRPARRGEIVLGSSQIQQPRCAPMERVPGGKEGSQQEAGGRSGASFAPRSFRDGSSGARPGSGSVWKALDQALRAIDLLLAAGGFGVVVLDMGGLPAEVVWKIPLATWFRYRAAAEKGRISLVLLTQHACARSSAEVVLKMKSATLEHAGTVVTGVRYQAELVRQRFTATEPSSETNVVSIRSADPRSRKGPQRETGWGGSMTWAAPSAEAGGRSRRRNDRIRRVR